MKHRRQIIKSSPDMTSERENVHRRCLNIASDGADVTCDGKLFQKLAPETGKARLPTVERLNSSTASWLEHADRSMCRDGTSVTRVKYDDRYAGWCTAVQSSVGRYGDLEQDALRNGVRPKK